MFGRSGQMFPRQRTFHDAIYEEEYGSDNEDECCRCRGLSAILCWFLSVIILVGLAATVVLTVFFILRSRTMMVKPNADVDVEMYGKDQNIFENAAAAGATSKEIIGSGESSLENGGVGGLNKRKKINTKQNGRGPPDATKNDVDADVNEEQNTIMGSSDEDQAEDASVRHHHHTHINNGRHNRLQPYSPVKTTTTTTSTTTTTEAPVEVSDEENNESSSEEIENDQTNGEGSSLFNLFSGPRNPSYSTPSQTDEEEETDDDDDNEQGVISAEASAEYKSTRYHDGSPVQQVLFTESPKVTLTTPSPYNTRRNLLTTRFPMGRTSFSTTSTTEIPSPQEESEEEEGDDDAENQNDDDAEEHNDDEGDDHDAHHHENEERSREEENHDGDNEEESHDDHAHDDKSSEEESKLGSTSSSAPPTTTSMYDPHSSEKEMGEESGESQLKQMLLDSIPPHGENKDEDQEHEDSGSSSNEPEGGASSSSEFNLSQNVHTTTTSTTTTTYKPSTTSKTVKPKSRQDTLSRLISRNFTRKGTSSTTETNNGSERETSTGNPTETTIGPAGHKYDYTMTPVERTKLKTKSAESTEQENTVTRAPPKFRYRSTTSKPSASPGPPSTAAPRTRGTTTISSAEFGIKMGSKRGSVESPIDIVPSPDLSKGIEQIKPQPNSLEGVDLNSASSEDRSKTSSEQQFLDVLVGSEDHKTLVTKKTDDGVVTSAILPPWYDPNGANSSITDVLATNGTELSNAVAKIEDEMSGEHPSFGRKTLNKKSSEENKDVSKVNSKENGDTEFDRLVSMFSKQEASSEEHPPQGASRFGMKKVNKPVILKKPGGSINSKYIPQVPGRASLFPSSKESIKMEQSNENKSSPSPPEASEATNSAGGDVGRTGQLPTATDVEEAAGYFPEHDKETGNMVEHQLVESERLQSEELEDSNEQEDPSHVIDVNFDDVQDNPAEIIIEQDSSAPTEDDDDGDFVDDDYEGYGENPPAMAMAGSESNHNVVAPPEDFTRGSGIRKPVSSEEKDDDNDMEKSASEMEKVNATTTTTTAAPLPPSTSSPPAAIRRPAYTREEILKSAVKPSPESLHNHKIDNSLHENHVDRLTGASIDATSGEYEEYEDDNYEGGSLEQETDHSLERWSSEKNDQRWSAPDQIMNTVKVDRQQFHDEEDDNENAAEESVAQPSIKARPNALEEIEGNSESNNTFKAPPLVSFHENKLNFAPPAHHDGEYHSKDGWRPVLSGSKNQISEDSPQEGFFNGGSASLEPDSSQVGSYEPEQDEPESQIPSKQQQQQLFQEQLPPHSPPPQIIREPISPPPPQMYQDPVMSPAPPQQMVPNQPQQHQAHQQQPVPHQHKWAQPDTTGSSSPQQSQHDNKLKPMIPPPVPAIVKFPDSEEDHEDRHHHGRNRLRRPMHFDRNKYLTRPVPPPIVMRRHPQNSGPGPYPPGPPKRPGPPPNQQRQQMVPQASHQNPQYAEPPPQLKQGRPQGPINRNFHIRPNPMRRFNFGGPPQAQPRSGGNLKWPTDDEGGSNRDTSIKNREGSRSEANNNNKRRRRRRRVIGG